MFRHCRTTKSATLLIAHLNMANVVEYDSGTLRQLRALGDRSASNSPAVQSPVFGGWLAAGVGRPCSKAGQASSGRWMASSSWATA